MDFATLELLRLHHPAWRLLRSDHAPLVASFLNRVFVAANLRSMAAADLAEALEDELFALRESGASSEFPKPAMSYLNDWSAPDKAWLRKFYKTGTDEAQFDLTPATEKAIAWLTTNTGSTDSLPAPGRHGAGPRGSGQQRRGDGPGLRGSPDDARTARGGLA